MKNLGAMLQQAQKMQQKMGELQAELAQMEVTGAGGGGMVQVTLTGKFEARRVTVDPSLLKAEDKAVVEDLTVAAFNDARSKVEALIASKMSELTGGLPLPPGLGLPF